ncbi:serine hydrolase domain-containing protein [uncultured Croceitalea sp.]|uniref:serine hydrolase domain-containing protein n=1 Tax=uncultured Croceitalea sp. TaxID=1798908 RepID=UPI003305FC81
MKQVYILITLFLIQFQCVAQEGKINSLNAQQTKTVDSLTSHWDKNMMPGGAIAIIHNGKIVYQSTLGLANTALGKKNTAQTPFLLAQISDNFVAYAMLDLINRKKLSLDSKLHNFLPYTTHLGKQITLRNLLEKSSGLHDFEVLRNIASWSDSSPFSISDVEQLISRQQNLNIEPGREFSDSRTNMVLLSEVIAKVSGISFSEYMEQFIFKPLGMKNSFVLSHSNQSQNNLAKSYRISEEGEAILIPSKKETYASINIAASIEDMVLWEMNLKLPSEKSKPIVHLFHTYVKLKNGKEYNIPMGKLMYGQKYVHKERGIETAMVTGGIDGYASAIFNFPSEEFTVITLSNNGESYNGYIGMLSAHSIIEDSFLEPATIDFSTIKTIKLNPNYCKKYEGLYWDAAGEISREIKIVNDTLRYIRSNGSTSAFIPLSNNKFQRKTDFDDKMFLIFKEQNGQISMQYLIGEATPFDFVKYNQKKISKEELSQTYSGIYYSKTLGIGYEINEKKGKLVASNIKSEDITFQPIMDELFAGDKWFLGSIEFNKDTNDNVKGFYVKNDAIRNLWFQKLDK